MSNISLVMNTLNEEENIRAVINCFESVINEVVIVDCNSTDNTRELARKLGARVYNIGQCPGYGEMRSISVHLAKIIELGIVPFVRILTYLFTQIGRPAW